MDAAVIPITRGQPEPVGGAQLVNRTRDFLTRFVSFTEPEQADAVTLWVLHTHAFGAADTTPRLAIQSVEKQSGKTRLLEMLDLLVANPLPTSNISTAALFRTISNEEGATLLIDEVDTVFSSRGKGREDLRGLLNAGYRRGSCVSRVTGGCVERFPVFAPVALAGIGRLPDTVQDRSIVIKLRRRPKDAHVDKLRWREVDTVAANLKASLESWGRAHTSSLAKRVPTVPPELGDRAADVWEPLLAIADDAGGVWPKRGRTAAVKLSGPGATTSELQEHNEILGRARKMFASLNVDRIPTADLMHEVSDLAASPKQLASFLRPLGISPRVMRDGDQVFRGYLRADFGEAV